MNPKQLVDVIGCSSLNASKFAAAITHAMDHYEINTPKRQAAFLAQVAHESALLTHVLENLNYSAAALLKYFHRHFTSEEAEVYARQPAKIANRAYANRMGNGDEASGDGWRYRGRGLIQITGKDNYKAVGEALGLDLLQAPELLLNAYVATQSAAWYWKSHGLNQLADAGEFDAITQRINGGQNGRDDRRALWLKATSALSEGVKA